MNYARLSRNIKVRYIITYEDILKSASSFTINEINIFCNPTFSCEQKEAVNDSTNYYENKELVITSLPGTKIEGERISLIFQNAGKKVNFFASKKATEENFKNQNYSNILHIATHGYYLNEEQHKQLFGIENISEELSPFNFSGILLANAQEILDNKNSCIDNGWLSSLEIQSINFSNLDLVVLSACNTGIGEIEKGRGTFSISSSIKIAGGKNIIASLWEVDDVVTSDFMTLFYEKLVESNDIDVSFNYAVSKIKSETSNPSKWAPFVLIK